LKQRRERSGHINVHALRGALIFPETQLPPRVFSWVMSNWRCRKIERRAGGRRVPGFSMSS